MNDRDIEQKLHIIAEKMSVPRSNSGLLRGKIGFAVFFYHYTRHFDFRYEEYAGQLINEVIEGIHEMPSCYTDGLAGIGVGIDYLARQGIIKRDINEFLDVIDRQVHQMLSDHSNSIEIKNGLIGYGKYYIARLKSQDNTMKTNTSVNFIKENLTRIVDFLSADYTYEDIYSIIGFLPDLIALNIHKEKACIYLNYAVDKLETMVYEDLFFGKYPGFFNPLITSVLLLRAAKKMDNGGLVDRAMCFLDRYEEEFRQYFPKDYAIKMSFLYQWLWKVCNCDAYRELSIQWFEKGANDNLNFEYDNLVTTGMMLLTMNESINDDWLDWFPIH